MDFGIDQFVIFEINGTKYAIYKHVAKMMDIFNVLGDCDDKNMISIEWKISAENVNQTLHLINHGTCIIVTEADKVEIISFMRYLCVADEVMKNTLKKLFNRESTHKFLEYCIYVQYNEIFGYILDKCIHRLYIDESNCTHLDAERWQMIKKIKKVDFSKDLKVKLMTNPITGLIPTRYRYNNKWYVTLDDMFCDIVSIYILFGIYPNDYLKFSDGTIVGYSGIMIDRDPTKKDAGVCYNIMIKNIAAALSE